MAEYLQSRQAASSVGYSPLTRGPGAFSVPSSYTPPQATPALSPRAFQRFNPLHYKPLYYKKEHPYQNLQHPDKESEDPFHQEHGFKEYAYIHHRPNDKIRHGPARYLGLVNEIAESFGPNMDGFIKLVPGLKGFADVLSQVPLLSKLSHFKSALPFHFVATTYAFVDATQKGSEAAQQSKLAGHDIHVARFKGVCSFFDALIFQAMVSVIVPALIIGRTREFVTEGIKDASMSKTLPNWIVKAAKNKHVQRWGATPAGLALIPIFIRYFDPFVEGILNETFRPYLIHVLYNKNFPFQPGDENHQSVRVSRFNRNNNLVGALKNPEYGGARGPQEYRGLGPSSDALTYTGNTPPSIAAQTMANPTPVNMAYTPLTQASWYGPPPSSQ